MQTESLRIKAYRNWRVEDNAVCESPDRLKRLERVFRLRAVVRPVRRRLRSGRGRRIIVG